MLKARAGRDFSIEDTGETLVQNALRDLAVVKSLHGPADMPRVLPILLLLILLGRADAYAPRPTYVASVEVIVQNFHDIARGKILRVDEGSSGVTLTIQPTQTIKGDTARRIEIHLNSAEHWKGCLKRGGDVIVGTKLSDASLVPSRVRGSWGTTGGWIVAKRAPAYLGEDFVLYDLTVPHDATFSMARLLTEPRDIVEAIVAAAGYRDPEEPASGGTTSAADAGDEEFAPEPVEVSFAELGLTDAPGTWRGRVLLPRDDRTGRLAREWARSANPSHRLLALSIVQQYPYAGWFDIAKSLLDDPAYNIFWTDKWTSVIDERAVRHYFIRQKAETLIRHVPRPVIIAEPHLRYRPVGWTLPISVAALVLSAALLAAWRATCRRFGWALAIIFLVALGSTVALWVRSRTYYHAATFAANGIEHEIVSVGNHITWLRVEDRAAARPLMVRSAAAVPTGSHWFNPLLIPISTENQGGFITEVGKTVSEPGAAGHGYRILQLHYWIPTAAFALWPAIFALVGLRRVLKRRRWRIEGCCTACGYDLRGTPGDSRCPECGSTRDPAAA